MERLTGRPYTEVFEALTGNSRIREFLRFNPEGDLVINRLAVPEIVEKYGAPVLIFDTEIIKKRAKDWQALAQTAASETGYEGGFRLVYAAKANPHSAAVVATDRAGCGHETSSFHDLLNFYGLLASGVVEKNGLVICNGFKLPPRTSAFTGYKNTSQNIVFESTLDRSVAYNDDSYADLIIRMVREGYQVVPVLDSGEADYFIQKLPPDRVTPVGLRAKFGKVAALEDLALLESRHGMSWEELRQTAAKIRESGNLKLTMLHTMVGAAETIPIEKFIASLSLAADMYFTLKKENPTLKTLNIGGGMAPLSEVGYDHQRFLKDFFQMLKQKARAENLPEPEVIFEFGSYLVSESGFYIFEAIQSKTNQVTKTGRKVEQIILEGGLMEALPDRFILGKEFLVLAGNQGNLRSKLVKIGDITCDSDGKIPKDVLVPDGKLPLYLVVVGVGAYQNILGGQGGASHCLVEQPKLVIAEMQADGLLHVRDVDVSERDSTRVPLGFTVADFDSLKKTV